MPADRSSQGECHVRQGEHGHPIVLAVEGTAARRRLASLLLRAFPNSSLFAAAGVRQAADVLIHHPVDIAVIDPDLPDGSGIRLIAECSRLSPLTRCVVTTRHDENDCLAEALAAGALGYLLEEQPETVRIQQLHLLAHGIPPLAPSIAQRLLRYFTAEVQPPAAGYADPHDELARLSGREKQVLRLIAKGLQIGEVAPLLEITANTVCSHIKSIYRKRHVSSRAEAALEAKRLGLI